MCDIECVIMVGFRLSCGLRMVVMFFGLVVV